jgi:hypothetical protein
MVAGQLLLLMLVPGVSGGVTSPVAAVAATGPADAPPKSSTTAPADIGQTVQVSAEDLTSALDEGVADGRRFALARGN